MPEQRRSAPRSGLLPLIITIGRRMGPNLIPTIPPMVIALTVLAVAFLGAPRLALIAEVAWNFLTGIRNHLMLLASSESGTT